MAEVLLCDQPDCVCLPTDLDLDQLQWTTLLYYLHETDPDNLLVRDKTDPAAPSSIAAVGMALATLPVVIERGVLFRPFAAKMARRRLRFLHDLPQGPEPDAAGYKGFFYHFLDIESGRRVWQCELSTIDSAFLLAGALTVATYFDCDTADEGLLLYILSLGSPTHPLPPESYHAYCSTYHFGIDQAPVALMIENYRTGL